jgi:iron complex transport system substrate-binding protein
LYRFYQKGLSGIKRSLLLLLLLIATVATCSSTAIEHNKVLTQPISTSCQVVHHMMGETCVPNKPQRIITIPFMILGNTLVLDFKPIGSTLPLGTQEKLTAKYLSTKTYLGNRTEGIKSIGRTHTPNLERMLLLKPDLILAWERLGAIYPLLSQIAPTVMIPYNFGQTNFHVELLNFIAKVLGKPETAQEATNHYYQRIEKLKVALGNRYQDQEISLLGASGLNSIYAYTKNSFAGEIFDDVGLKRPSAQNIVTPLGVIYNISQEILEQIDGDIAFFLLFGNESTETLEKLQQKPLWKKLKFVQNNQIYLVDGDAWIGANLLAADAIIDDLYKYLVNQP